MNLMSNAVKFTERGNINITAKILEDEKLQMSIRDTGIGIKKEDLARLFEPFQSVGTIQTMKYEGTGLGLYLVKKLVEFMGGDVSVTSIYGEGSGFSFIIPLKCRGLNK